MFLAICYINVWKHFSICATTVPASRGGLEFPLEFIVSPCVLEFIPSSSQHVDLSITTLSVSSINISLLEFHYWRRHYIKRLCTQLSLGFWPSGQFFFHSDASDFQKSTKCSVLILDSPPAKYCFASYRSTSFSEIIRSE